MDAYPQQGYIRHRHRMVRQSVYEDLLETLALVGWLPGGATPTTMAILGDHPLRVIDYFPENENNFQGDDIDPNTLAIDGGKPEPPVMVELGGNLHSQIYVFSMAFFASNDAIAQALLADLQDRYLGMAPRSGANQGVPTYESGGNDISLGEAVMLYNYFDEPPTQVVRMGVEEFRYSKGTDQIVPGLQIHYAELTIEDYLETSL